MVKLVTEEFNQLHDHLREHEKSINSLMIVIATASAALLSAVGLFYYRVYSANPDGVNIAFSYLFLSPTLITIPIMSAIRGHRASLYKMGVYIKVFLEGEESGAMWHRRLEKYQVNVKGESSDSMPYFSWVISAIAYSFFVFTIAEIQHVHAAHYILPAVVLIPILLSQHVLHNEVKDISKMESVWRKIRDDEVRESASI